MSGSDVRRGNAIDDREVSRAGHPLSTPTVTPPSHLNHLPPSQGPGCRRLHHHDPLPGSRNAAEDTQPGETCNRMFVYNYTSNDGTATTSTVAHCYYQALLSPNNAHPHRTPPPPPPQRRRSLNRVNAPDGPAFVPSMLVRDVLHDMTGAATVM